MTNNKATGFLNKKITIYLLFFILMFTSFSQYYLQNRVPFTSPDPIISFGLNKEHIDNLKDNLFATWFPNYNLGINKSGWDPQISPFSLPNIISAMLPFDTTATYIITRHATIALMGFTTFLLLLYLGFSFSLALLGGIILMFNPMTDEHHYIGNWTYPYIFTPLGIILLHEWMKDNSQLVLLFLWSLLSGALYLTGGINGLLYVFFGIGLYAIALAYIFQWNFKQISSCSVFLLVSGLISLAIGAYIFIPGIDTFMFQEKRMKNIDTSFFYFSQFSLTNFIKGIISFVFPWNISIFLPNFDWGFQGRINISIGRYWNYLNILILPVIIILFKNWIYISKKTKGLLIFVIIYYFLFLNPFLINPDFILKIFPIYTFSKNFSIYYLCLAILIITVIEELQTGKIELQKPVKTFISLFESFYFIAAFLFLLLIIFFNCFNSTNILKAIYEKFGAFEKVKIVLVLRLAEHYFFKSWTSIFILFLLLARGMQLRLFKKYKSQYFIVSLIFLCAIEYSCFTRLYFPFIDKDTLQFRSGITEENIFIQNLPTGVRIAYQKPSYSLFDQKREYEYDKKLFDFSISEVKNISFKNHPIDYMYTYSYPFKSDLAIMGVYNFAMKKNLFKYYTRMAKGNPLYDEQVKINDEYVYYYLYNVNEHSPLTKPIFSYLITQYESNAPHLKKVLKGRYYNIYKNEQALPRAYFITNTIYEPDINKALDILEDPDFDWKKKAIVEDKRFKLKSPSDNSKSFYKIKKQKIFYNDVHIEIENNEPGILILNDLYYPYWNVTNNSKDAELIRVNGIFRGVKIGPGKNTVKMHFHNPKLNAGVWISIISTFLCIIAIIYFYKNQKKKLC